MRNFLKIAQGLDPWPLLHALATQPELWNQYKVRAAHQESVHLAIDDIILRYNPYNTGEDFLERVCSEIHCVDYPAWAKLPPAQVFVYGMLAKVMGLHLGRVMISRVKPGEEIPLHSDRIEPAEQAWPGKIPPAQYYERYHVVLQSQPGVVFECGGEACYMAPGEAWWFNNQLPHRVINNSPEDRLHLIMDIRTLHDDYVPS